MAVKRPSGKLAVILHADIAGSTQLVQKDEQLAHERIQSTFRALGSVVTECNGHVRELRGDALLSEFERASDAVIAALTFQGNQMKYLAEVNDNLVPMVRIGIAMGEVVIADNTVTGAGVVLAQRLEQLAAPGKVVVQGPIFETVPSRFPFKFASLGEQKLKGFDQPVRAFSVDLESGKTLVCSLAEGTTGSGLVDQSTQDQRKLTSSSVIAVLPFTNMSGEPEQEYFSDGISEDIITELSKFRSLSVIARNSSFRFRGQSVDIKEVGRELSADYVLEGSVRKVGQRARVSAQLIDATSDHHIWADKFDRDLQDVFEIQDEISRSVVSATVSRIEDTHFELAEQKQPSDMRAYDFWLRGKRAFNDFTLVGMDRAIELFKQAIEIDPGYARGYAGLGLTHNMRTSYCGWGKPIDEAHERALELAKKAVSLDDTDHWNQFILGWCHLFLGNYSEAKRHYDKSISINPNDSESLIYRAAFLGYNGDHREALECLDQGFRLNPLHPDWFLDWAVTIYISCRKTRKALEMARDLDQDSWPEAPGWLSVAHAYEGNTDYALQLAKMFVSNVRKLWLGEGIPGEGECIEWLLKDNPIRREQDRQWFVEGFRMAGLTV